MKEHRAAASSPRDLILNALLIALTAVITMIIQIPTPVTKGYVNMGDLAVIGSGFMLGGKRGALIGGLGSAMADFLGGHFLFIPGTLLIKGCEGYLAGMVPKDADSFSQRLFRGSIAALAMVAGYYLYEMILLGQPAAVTALIPNMLQGFLGLSGALALFPLLQKALSLPERHVREGRRM